MKRPFILQIIVFLLALPVLANAQPQPATSRSDGAEPFANRVIVKLSEPTGTPSETAWRALRGIVAEYEITSIGSWLDTALLRGIRTPTPSKTVITPLGAAELARILVVEYAANIPPEIVAAKLSGISGIAYAEPIYRRHLHFIPNDPKYSQQWYLRQVEVEAAWDVARADSTIVIAIVDTGIDLIHPDLRAAIWRNLAENGKDGNGRDRRSNGIDDDANGYIDDWTGYDFGGFNGASPDNNPTAGHWHGTHVAGIAAAAGDNGVGVIGVGFGAKLMAVKISDDQPEGDPYLNGGFNAILYAAKMGARIINCSWGGPGKSRAEQEVIDNVSAMGSLVISSVGNEGRNTITYPASYRGVLSVASVMPSDERSVFSNFNASVGIAAPGEEIFSTLPTTQIGMGYGVKSGTSMSSPVVSGAAALVAAKFPSLEPEQIAAVLRANSDDIDGQNPKYRLLLGSGRLNVRRAVSVGPNALAVDILDHQIIDENGDGIVEPGETVELRVQVKNILRPTDDLRLDITSATGPSTVILAPTAPIGTMLTGQVKANSTGTLRLVAPADVSLDYILPIEVSLHEGEQGIGAVRIEMIVNPSYATTSSRRLLATFTGNGRIGYGDFPTNQRGEGFRFEQSLNMLAEGGMLIGISPSHLADVVRSAEIGVQSEGLQTVAPYRVSFSDRDWAEIGRARFDDSHLLDLQQIGLEVELTTFAYYDPALNNQVISLYRIRNTSGRRLDSLFCALFLDWDIGSGGAKDQTRFNSQHRLGYAYNTENPGLPYAGAVLLSDEPMNFYALDNRAYPLADGFFQAEKWDVISGGIKREVSRVGDCSMIVGAGPISLDAGADTTIAFSLMAGGNLAELQSSAESARTALERLGLRAGGPIMLPRELKLVTVGPNPFNGRTTLQFWMPDEGKVVLDLYDARGGLVTTLIDGVFPKGIHTVELVPENVSDGVYFVRLFAFNQTLLEKVVHAGE